MSSRPVFFAMCEAFAYCREKNCPTIVIVNGQTHKIYPSGKAVPVPQIRK